MCLKARLRPSGRVQGGRDFGRVGSRPPCGVRREFPRAQVAAPFSFPHGIDRIATERPDFAKFVLQGVHMNFRGECSAGARWRPDEPRLTKLVLIGRGLDRKVLAERFRRCLVAA